MSTWIFLIVLVAYFGALLMISWLTSRKADNQSFFRANRSAPWYLVAFGMIGTSLSGVTFVSVPGTVGSQGFLYFQVVIGYFIGYFVVAGLLLPLYYRLNLTSIYSYLLDRFGMYAYKTGALFFILSRTLGATLRLFLVINVLQLFILDDMGISFGTTAGLILLMILAYTFKGGVKTIVWTDTLQTLFMLLALVVCVAIILSRMDLSMAQAFSAMTDAGYTRLGEMDWQHPRFWVKQILGGAFITIAMTGLDQEMMQKNISVRTLGDSQKNMISFSVVLVLVNFLFLFLGGLLYLYAQALGLEVAGDDLFPTIAMDVLPPVVSMIFLIGLISALFPSADGAITALTASFSIDILGIQRREDLSENRRTAIRKRVHLVFAAVFLVCVFFFEWLDNKSIIDILLAIAGYTYGPLLGLFAFGMFTRKKPQDHLVPLICMAAPLLAWMIDRHAAGWFGGYRFGFELLILNGALTCAGLALLPATKSARA
ncbi:MAG: sodium:solute symporter [Flavobacteriales bacterium]